MKKGYLYVISLSALLGTAVTQSAEAAGCPPTPRHLQEIQEKCKEIACGCYSDDAPLEWQSKTRQCAQKNGLNSVVEDYLKWQEGSGNNCCVACITY